MYCIYLPKFRENINDMARIQITNSGVYKNQICRHPFGDNIKANQRAQRRRA